MIALAQRSVWSSVTSAIVPNCEAAVYPIVGSCVSGDAGWFAIFLTAPSAQKTKTNVSTIIDLC